MISKKGPAVAGLFFALSLIGVDVTAGDGARLSAQEQDGFRRFVEVFTPLVLRHEKKARNYRWHSSNRDCAGLIRYLFWEALQTHDDRFLDNYPALRASGRVAPSPQVRSVSREWQAANQNAAQLISHSRLVTRRPETRALKTADILYFYSAELKIRHVMLVIRSAESAFVVYHTGDKRDELRIRSLADLTALPEPQWHADPQNLVFQGVFRPRFLE